MRVLFTFMALFAMFAAGFVAVSPPAANAAGEMEMCTGTTIQSLHHCVQHAYDMGHIDNAGVAHSLLAKLDAAQAALDRSQPLVAVNKLQAFINEVNAQSGRHIAAEHAAHMVMHAQHVIAALRP